jgi:hypothetical protein
MRVRIGDVQAGEKFGKIALESEGEDVVRCRKGRKFI